MRPDEKSRRTGSSSGRCSFPKMKGDEKNHEIRFKQIERTLKYALDEDERRIIEMKYLGNRKVKDSNEGLLLFFQLLNITGADKCKQH